MSVKVQFDPQDIFSKLQKSTDVAVSDVAFKVLLDTDQFVPKSPPNTLGSGMLRDSADIKKVKKNQVDITYERPTPTFDDVAPWMWEGINPKTGAPVENWYTPGTGDHWFELSKDEFLDDWIDYFREETKRIWRKRKQKY